MTNAFRKCVTRIVAAAAILTSAAMAQNATNPVMSVVVDETQAPRRIAFVHEEIRVKPGALALAYPKWIPGEHGPTGPIQEFAMLRIHAGDAALPWTRDPGRDIHDPRRCSSQRRENHG